jgi:hypothetical protein
MFIAVRFLVIAAGSCEWRADSSAGRYRSRRKK